MLRILADANIPHAADAFGRYGTVSTLPGRDITPEALQETDVLLVRSVTPVTGRLVSGTPVQFVATATAGTDHIERGPLADAGVSFASAPGSNAASVVDWVLTSLLCMAAEKGVALAGKTLGIVGVGAVGGRVAARAEAMGMTVLCCDPPRADRGEPGNWHSLDHLLRSSDILTLHTPLAKTGEHPTHHLIGEAELAVLKEGAWVLNAARGPVVSGDALFRAVTEGRLGAVALDVWEGEPVPHTGLASRVDIATPHIAGYAYDGKIRGTVMVERALRDWLAASGADLPDPWDASSALAPASPLIVRAPDVPHGTPEARTRWLDALAQQAYSIREDDRRFRNAVVTMPDEARRGVAFAALRKSYPIRREWSQYSVTGHVPLALRRAVSEGLGMRIELP